MKTAVMGAGSWGTAVAVALAANGHDISLWGRNESTLSEMEKTRENKKYLPEVILPENIKCLSDSAAALEGAEIVFFVVPAQSFRSTLETMKSKIKPGAIIVNCSKGIELGTLKRASEIAAETAPEFPFAVLSGPSHAEEVGRKMPTMLVSASADMAVAEKVQDAIMSDFMRVYTDRDVIGVELGGALKNIIALAAGISDGMGHGDNARAALMTRSMTEITRLGRSMGAEAETFMGLAGIGDLIVTCTSMHSRNHRCGMLIGRGMAPDEAVKEVGMVVEGMYTTEAAYEIAEKYGVEMPVTQMLYAVIKGRAGADEALKGLMTRKKKAEKDQSQ